MSRTATSIRFTCLLALALSALAGRSSAVTVSIAPADTTVEVGHTFSLRVAVGAFPDLKGFQVVHTFDPALVQLTGVQPGDVLTLSGLPFSAFLVPDLSAPADSSWYDAAVLVGSSQGPGILAFVDFTALAEGDCPVACVLADLRDSQNRQTLPDCMGGMVHIVGPVPVSRGTWGRVKTLYR